MKDTTNRRFKRSLAAMAVGVCLATSPIAIADNLNGSIYGKALAGKTITVTNPSTGFKREVLTNESGRFNFSKLPTGKYTVSNGTDTYNTVVTIGTGSTVDFLLAAERIEVYGSTITSIDTTSVESTTVFTSEQIDLLPVGRSLTSVSLLAPGTVQGDSGFSSNLASFGGASVAENGYFINGFDVTNIRNFVSFADLPYDAVGQQQVKTGGYGAEYGRSLGGVINIVTKRGSNDWKFGGSAYYTPEGLREAKTDSVSKDPALTKSNKYSTYGSANTYDSKTYNLFASGAIIEDQLFFFGLYEGRSNETNIYGSSSSTQYNWSSPMMLAKIDWNITDDHLLEFTYIKNESERDTLGHTNTKDADGNTNYYTGKHGDAGEPYTLTNGGEVTIASYTGFITDSFSVSALVGKMTNLYNSKNPAIGPGAECELVYDRRETPTSSQRIGCWGIAQGQTTVPEAGVGPEEDIRESLRLGAEWVLGDHTLRFGYDQELFTSSKRGTTYSGGDYWRWHLGQGKKVNGVVVEDGAQYVRHMQSNRGSGEFEVENTALYIEDSWQVNDEWLAYIGLRSEGFVNRNGSGDTFVEADNLVAPRLGFNWDIGGEGTKKLFATAGRYYIPVASNTNIRASGIAYSFEEYFYVAEGDEDPVTHAPTKLGAPIGERNNSGINKAPDSRTVAATNLSPMYQDEYILGYQQQVDNWILGARFINRKIKDGMDDYCSHQPFIDYAKDNGYNDFDYHTMAKCMMMNPGRDFSIAMDLENNGNFEVTTVPKEYFGLEVYKRTYNALELNFERPFSDGWYVQGSYTHASSKGNGEGYVNSTNEQEDAGLTQDIDNALFQHGAYGPLPSDRKHTLKIFGAYQINEEVTVSANLLLQSGRPVSCQGYAPLNDLKDELGVDYGGLANYGSSTYYCNGVLTQRGDFGRTPWTKNVDLGLSYKPTWADGLSFKVDLRNAFNFQGITEYQERAESGSATAPIADADFLNPVNFQSPRRVTLNARYSF